MSCSWHACLKPPRARPRGGLTGIHNKGDRNTSKKSCQAVDVQSKTSQPPKRGSSTSARAHHTTARVELYQRGVHTRNLQAPSSCKQPPKEGLAFKDVHSKLMHCCLFGAWSATPSRRCIEQICHELDGSAATFHDIVTLQKRDLETPLKDQPLKLHQKLCGFGVPLSDLLSRAPCTSPGVVATAADQRRNAQPIQRGINT
mmetsp:Transcript_134716/g.430389  ORF Transcript_134716/g.430389 Transcript_134716/m.430389 type:complete len:201 (+) Transcript_134716:216-818(+)